MRQSLDPISSGPLISVLFDRCLDLMNSGPSRVPLMCSVRAVLALTESPHIHKALISVRHPASEDAVPARLVSRLAAYPVFRPDHRSRLLRYSVDSNHIPLVKLKTYSLVLLSYHTCSDFQEHAANFFEKLAPACDAALQIPNGSPRRPFCAGGAAFPVRQALLFFRLHDLPYLAHAFVQRLVAYLHN